MPWIRCAPLGTAALLACLVSSCDAPVNPDEPLPSVASTAAAAQVTTAVEPVSAIPTPVARTSTAVGFTLHIHERFSPIDSLSPRPLWVFDGVVLGRRRDGTIDHKAAQRQLGRLDPRRIVSIEVLKGVRAIQLFGPIAKGGAVLIMTRPVAARETERKP